MVYKKLFEEEQVVITTTMSKQQRERFKQSGLKISEFIRNYGDVYIDEMKNNPYNSHRSAIQRDIDVTKANIFKAIKSLLETFNELNSVQYELKEVRDEERIEKRS